MKVVANGIEIEVEDSAAINPQDADLRARAAVLLVMGLGMQLIAWPQQWVQELLDAGFRVVRFDNRDAGLSTHLDALGKPNLCWASLKYKLGGTPRPMYSVADMAADALGVLDALGIWRAHVVGASMGGMVAQRMAIAAPERVLSLTSIMSSSGARGLPPPDKKVLRQMFQKPEGEGLQGVVEHAVRLLQAIGSPAFPLPEDELRLRVEEAVQRSFYPEGTLRQTLAVLADTERAALLAQVTAPTLVLHGKADLLVPLACGEDTARRIPGARLVDIEGMGHDFAPQAVALMLPELILHLTQSERRREGPRSVPFGLAANDEPL